MQDTIKPAEGEARHYCQECNRYFSWPSNRALNYKLCKPCYDRMDTTNSHPWVFKYDRAAYYPLEETEE